MPSSSLIRLANFCAIMFLCLSTMAWGAAPPIITGVSVVGDGMSSPVRVAVDGAGNMFVTDPRGGGVIKYSPQGARVGVIAMAAPPQGIAVRQDGSLVVTQGNFVSILNGAGAEIRKLGAGVGQFQMANGVALDSAGGIYVVDSLANEVQAFDASGGFRARFGSAGSGSGQMMMPTAIAYDSTSNSLAVVDTLNGRIQFFDTTGIFLKSVGGLGSGPMSFTAPVGVAFEYSRDPSPVLLRMYVADAFQSNVQAIDPAGIGSYLSTIGSYGSAAGQLIAPSDVAFDPVQGRLLVVNGAGNLTIYAMNTGTTPPVLPPRLTIDPLPATTAATSITIGGTIEAGATVSVTTDSGAVAGAAAYPSPTTWNVLVSGLRLGVNTLTVKAAGANGLTTTLSVSVTLVTNPLALSLDPLPTLISQTSYTLGGTMASGATVTVNVPVPAAVGTVSYPAATTWRCTVTGLVNGDNTVTVRAANASGGTASVTGTLSVDTQPPVITLTALPNNSITGEQVQNFSGSVTDAHLDTLTVNGRPVAMAAGKFSVPVSLVVGANSIDVTAADLAGNKATVTRTLTYAPAFTPATITAPADGAITRSSLFTCAGTVQPGMTVRVNGGVASMNGTSWSAMVNLVAGVNTILVETRDGAGNSVVQKRTLTYDAVAPELALTGPPQDQAMNIRVITTSGTVTPGATVTCSLNGSAVQPTVNGSSFNCSAPITSDGSYAMTVIVTENGISSSSVRTIIADTVPPVLLIDPPASPAPGILTGRFSPGMSISASDKNGPVGTLAVTDSTWRLDLSGVSYDPATLTVSAVDAAGNRAWRNLAFTGPDGDLSGDGKVSVADALKALRLVVNMDLPTVNDYLHADIGMVANGRANPKGSIELSDALTILRRAIGLDIWQ